MTWECFYVKSDSFETAAQKKAQLEGDVNVNVMVNVSKIDCLFLFVNWVLLLGTRLKSKGSLSFRTREAIFT